MKTAVVTGAGGFIGSVLSKRLLEDNYKVYGVDVNDVCMKELSSYKNFVPICADLKTAKLSEFIHENIDVMFYLAWMTAGEFYYNVEFQLDNVSTTARICEDSAAFCNHFIFCSSNFEYMRNVENTKSPFNVYGISKGFASDLCSSILCRNGKKFNKAIFANTYGFGDRSKRSINTILKKMMNGEELTLIEGKYQDDWVYIDDTVRGLISIFENGINYKSYYIGHREITTFKEKIQIMRDIVAPDMELEFGTMKESTYVDYSMIDLDALYNDTGFECAVNYKDSIVKTVEWLNLVCN